MLHQLVRLSLLVAAVSASSSRRLDDQNYNGDSSSSSSNSLLVSGTCFRMKIAENNGDDDGNSYFYNGAYRSQQARYIAFELCSSSSNGNCEQYVTQLDTYLQQTVPYFQSLCNSCSQTCRRALRALEDHNQEEEGNEAAAADEQAVQVDCNTCENTCQRIANNGYATDEADYLECQQSANNDEDGMQYYTAPQCDDGKIVIGHFYDDECSIKTTKEDTSTFAYATFATLQESRIDCSSSDNNNNVCSNLLENAISCSSNSQSSTVCKAAASAARVATYYTKPLWKKYHVVFILFLSMVLLVLVLGLSHTYFVRHRLQKHLDLLDGKKVPMADLDGTTAAADEGAMSLPTLT
jgi:hypothetical protein